MGKKELHDFQFILHKETEKAIQVSENGDPQRAVWLPKSQIEYEVKPNGLVDVTVPLWLCEEKKFAGF